MGVAADHNVNLSRDWIEIQVVDVVNDVDNCRSGLKHLRRWKARRPRRSVDVAFDCPDRCNRTKLFEDRRIADIAGVDDEVGAAQGIHSLRPEQAVGVRNYAD